MAGISAQVTELQEVGISLSALDFRPQMLNLDVLRLSGVLPADWEVSQQPVVSPQVVQLNFTNGVNLIAQPRQVLFLQRLAADPEQMQVPQFAQRYLDKFAHADYQSVNIAPKILLAYPGQPDVPQRFMTTGLLNPRGAWQHLGQDTALQASVTLNYRLKRCPLTINISEVNLNQGEQTAPALLFAGTFQYGIPEQHRQHPIAYLSRRIQKWLTDCSQFHTVVHRKFLGSLTQEPTDVSLVTTSVFPNLEP